MYVICLWGASINRAAVGGRRSAVPCPWRVPLNRTNTQCNLSASEPRLARAFLARVNNDGTCAYHPRRIIIGIYLHTVRATLLLLLLRFIVCANRRVYTRVCTHAGRCTAPYGPPCTIRAERLSPQCVVCGLLLCGSACDSYK